MIIKKVSAEKLLFALLVLSILPVINVMGFEMPVLYLLTPFSMFLFMLVLFGWIKIPSAMKPVVLIFLLIMVEILISSVIGTTIAFNKIIFPTDIFQYVARFMCLLTFVIMFYYSKLESEIFIKMFLFVLVLAMAVGILQWIPWRGQTFFIELYPFREGSEQLAQIGRELYQLRVHGVAQIATANGGIATFVFIFAYSVFSYLKKYKLLSVILMVVSITNIFASQARAGMFAFVFSLFTFYFTKIYIRRKFSKSTIYFLALIAIIWLVLYNLYNSGNPYILQMVYRWIVLFDTGGGERINQISYGLSLLSDPYQYFWGISRAVQSHSESIFHLEVEPINIFVLYGVIGFILQYFLVLYLLKYFINNIRRYQNDPAILSLLIASFVGLASYQVFSFGYFFFREIRIGLIPWILMGVTIGISEKHKKLEKLDHKGST